MVKKILRLNRAAKLHILSLFTKLSEKKLSARQKEAAKERTESSSARSLPLMQFPPPYSEREERHGK
ncbi:hypothetical protein [Bacteroides sp. KG122]|uniref:hypothetical protein n=1 Tax=unclassified Bacteroides TaxID=2646097 RepID=UPI003D953055